MILYRDFNACQKAGVPFIFAEYGFGQVDKPDYRITRPLTLRRYADEYEKSKSIDLTSGPILKTLSELALPIMASSLLGTAYNITDMAWIGLLGSKAVAGVGWAACMCGFPRTGSPSENGRTGKHRTSCGRKDYKEARSYAASALQMTILFGLLFCCCSKYYIS